jgi:leucyl-tRNA synthetase
VWALCLRHTAAPDASPGPALERHLGIAAARVTRALVEHQFHLAARNLRLLVDRLEQYERRHAAGSLNKAVLILIRLLAPLCPHIAEELWARLGGTGLVAAAAWPHADVPRRRAEE